MHVNAYKIVIKFIIICKSVYLGLIYISRHYCFFFLYLLKYSNIKKLFVCL
jgi:hypothetical protein